MVMYPDPELYGTGTFITFDDLWSKIKSANIVLYNRNDDDTLVSVDGNLYTIETSQFQYMLRGNEDNNTCPICLKRSHIHEYQGVKMLNLACLSCAKS